MIRQRIMDHKLPAFIAGSVLLAAILVTLSMFIYYASGASRLDLSRPEYTSMRSKIDQGKALDEGFAAQGEITKSTIDEFMKLYKAEAAKTTSSQNFAVDALSDTNLGITQNQSNQ